MGHVGDSCHTVLDFDVAVDVVVDAAASVSLNGTVVFHAVVSDVCLFWIAVADSLVDHCPDDVRPHGSLEPNWVWVPG